MNPTRTSTDPLDEPATLAWFVGIEDTCVYPRGADAFEPLDEHHLTGHSKLWREDIDQVADLGATGIRYGMSWPTVHRGWAAFDWSRVDPVVERLAGKHGLAVAADLVHYGCPPWLEGSFTDPRFADALVEFALAVVDRYGLAIPLLTPVNEPLTTASFCGLRKVWPPALGSWSGWAQVTVAVAEAAQAVTRAVRRTSPMTRILHVEAGHHYETEDPGLEDEVAHLEALGWLATDLVVGNADESNPLWAWLNELGIASSRLAALRSDGINPDYLGLNYYPDLTPRVLVTHHDRTTQVAVDRGAAGLETLLVSAAKRYDLPIVVSETSVEGSDAHRLRWLESATDSVRHLRSRGVDIRGFTWWPLIDFVDWSYTANGESVEEFLPGQVDPTTGELTPRSHPPRLRSDGIEAFTRGMGLLRLRRNDGQLVHTPTVVADAFRRLATDNQVPTGPARLWSAGSAFEASRGAELSLDGMWVLEPDAVRAEGTPVKVPGLWEAQGHQDVDGQASYCRRFAVPDPGGHWTLRFGAVMDTAEVMLNGAKVGAHHLPFTPFEVDATGLLQHGVNELIVEVTDPPAGSAAHLDSPHGKQGWANHEFPSPPSMYLTYGGIWQSVTLRSHGEVAIRDIASNLDPSDLTVTVELHNVCPQSATAAVRIELAELTRSTSVELAAGQRHTAEVRFGRVELAPWQPEEPTLHRCAATVVVDGEPSDAAALEIGIRTTELTDDGLAVNGRTIHLKSVLVQGFHPERLYADGSVDEIEAEVRAAKALGFNMLRLHLRAFSPEYLRVCDRMGMLLHCDVPIGEPIDHDQLAGDGPLARRCQEALTAQVRRDRSHPSIVLWSCMNEVGIDRPTFRSTDRYEGFVTRMADTLRALDPTRPFLENDWIEPDLDRVFRSTLLSAHWYGHLDRRYLDALEVRAADLNQLARPVAVTEFGDWGLPDPDSTRGRFYEHESSYREAIAATPWPGTLEQFSAGTQTYQGVANRLQIDILRRATRVVGYCLTQLTDVPHEFNGILDINRHPKRSAIAVREANQPLSPTLTLDNFGAFSGSDTQVALWISNDTTDEYGCEATITHRQTSGQLTSITVPAGATILAGTVQLAIEGHPGESEIAVELASQHGDATRAAYPLVVHSPPTAAVPATVVGTSDTSEALAHFAGLGTGAQRAASDMLLVGECSLDTRSAELLRTHLAAGGLAVVLAQRPEHAALYPTPVTMQTLATDWGGTPFRYTTNHRAVRAYPTRAVMHVHDADIAPDAIVTALEGSAHPATVAIGVFKPPPRPAAGSVLAALSVGPGTLVVCQYRLEARLENGSPTAAAVLDDVITWAERLHRPTS